MTRSNLGADTMAKSNPVSRGEASHLSVDNSIRDLLNHSAFTGYSRLLMPWSDRTYDENMRLGDMSSLLPYHSHVDPKTVLAGLNHMIDDMNNDRPVFYDFYTEAQKRADPTKKTPVCSSFAESLEHPSQSYRPAEASRMSAPSTKDFRTPSRSAAKDTTHSFLNTGRALAALSPQRIWPQQSPTYSEMQKRLASIRGTTRYGAVRQARGWRQPSAHMALQRLEATIFQNRRPS